MTHRPVHARHRRALLCALLLAGLPVLAAPAFAGTCGVLPFTASSAVGRGAADNIASLVSTEADIQGGFELVLAADPESVAADCGSKGDCIVNYAKKGKFEKVITGHVEASGSDRYDITARLHEASGSVVREILHNVDRKPDALLEGIPGLVSELLTGNKPEALDAGGGVAGAAKEKEPLFDADAAFEDEEAEGAAASRDDPKRVERDRQGRKVRDRNEESAEEEVEYDALGVDELEDVDLDELMSETQKRKAEEERKRREEEARLQAERDRIEAERRREEEERRRIEEERRMEEERARAAAERRREEEERQRIEEERRRREEEEQARAEARRRKEQRMEAERRERERMEEERRERERAEAARREREEEERQQAERERRQADEREERARAEAERRREAERVAEEEERAESSRRSEEERRRQELIEEERRREEAMRRREDEDRSRREREAREERAVASSDGESRGGSSWSSEPAGGELAVASALSLSSGLILIDDEGAGGGDEEDVGFVIEDDSGDDEEAEQPGSRAPAKSSGSLSEGQVISYEGDQEHPAVQRRAAAAEREAGGSSSTASSSGAGEDRYSRARSFSRNLDSDEDSGSRGSTDEDGSYVYRRRESGGSSASTSGTASATRSEREDDGGQAYAERRYDSSGRSDEEMEEEDPVADLDERERGEDRRLAYNERGVPDRGYSRDYDEQTERRSYDTGRSDSGSGARASARKTRSPDRSIVGFRVMGGMTNYYLFFAQYGAELSIFPLAQLSVDVGVEGWTLSLETTDANGNSTTELKTLPSFNIGASYRAAPHKVVRPYVGADGGGIYYATGVLDDGRRRALFAVAGQVKGGCDFMIGRNIGLFIGGKAGVAYAPRIQETVTDQWRPLAFVGGVRGGVVLRF
jgi:hypothetical protein